MSYDIRFKVKVEGVDKYVNVGDCDANITWNVRKIIELSTGLPWHNCANNGYCKDIMPAIERGFMELHTNPAKYKPYEAANGWGTVNGTKAFFEHLLHCWRVYCEWEDPAVVDVTTFWIE